MEVENLALLSLERPKTFGYNICFLIILVPCTKPHPKCVTRIKNKVLDFNANMHRREPVREELMQTGTYDELLQFSA
jgi:hypothetical protein